MLIWSNVIGIITWVIFYGWIFNNDSENWILYYFYVTAFLILIQALLVFLLIFKVVQELKKSNYINAFGFFMLVLGIVALVYVEIGASFLFLAFSTDG